MEETQKPEGGRESTTTSVFRVEASARVSEGPEENPRAAEMGIKQAERRG